MGRVFKASGATPVQLPTYAFQKERFWLAHHKDGVDLAAAGLAAADHPLLSAAVSLPDGESLMLTGRLSLDTHPWLSDHAVMGDVLLPATAFLELALAAGRNVGCDAVPELSLEAPLVISDGNAVEIRVSLGEPDEIGVRPIRVFSRLAGTPDGGLGDSPWTRHAAGVVASGDTLLDQPPDGIDQNLWPPAGAESVDVEKLYDELERAGLQYGEAFRGLHAAWRDGTQIFAEVRLPEEDQQQAQAFVIHPALLDAGLHASARTLLGPTDAEGAGEVRLPFSWSGVRMYASGASSLRVRIRSTAADTISLFLADEAGQPVASVDGMRVHGVSREQLAVPRSSDSLFRVRWKMLAPSRHASTVKCAVLGAAGAQLASDLRGVAGRDEIYPDLQCLGDEIASGRAAPDLVFADCRVCEPSTAARLGVTRELTHRALRLLQEWLADEHLLGSRLVLITSQAVDAEGEAEVLNVEQAPVWGLVRSAQSEHPGRFVLVDIDRDPSSWQALPLALEHGQSQLAIRDGVALVPRLERVRSVPVPKPFTLDRRGTVLITGGTSGLGALVAEHLAREYGSGHLLLASRRGPEAKGALDLKGHLESYGARITIATCDVGSRSDLVTVLRSVPEELPLTGVIHCAGVLDDGVIGALTPQRIDNVFSAKAAGAWHLHELTQHMNLAMFVLFSSVADTLGSAGQGSYAAANAFLDALAAFRRAQGLAGSSMAWGWWEPATGMTADLSDTDRFRLSRSGVCPMSTREGLELFDRALAIGDALLVPARLDFTQLRAMARSQALPEILGTIVRAPSRSVRDLGPPARQRLADAPADQREAIALDVVLGHVVAILGHASPESVSDDRAFKALGFDSLAGVELRNRLQAATGTQLPATLTFDHPRPSDVARYLLEQIDGGQAMTSPAAKAIAHDEALAIVGMSCRYPGGVCSPQELWELVAGGVDAIGGFPSDRGWELDALFDPDPDHPGTTYTRHGGFLYDASEFDAAFFEISPREALAMDPQQRLLLEGAWEAFENAGIDPLTLRGTRTGVYAGSMYHDYSETMTPRPTDLEGYLGTGLSGGVVSGRVAFTLGLEGPAISVDTACSSSLVALHLACQALRAGECTMALAGGVTVMSSPTVFIEFARQHGLAADGRCKPFAAAARRHRLL